MIRATNKQTAVQGQNRDDVREHTDVHQRPENLIAALEIKTLVGECRQRGDEYRKDRDHTGNDEGILEHLHQSHTNRKQLHYIVQLVKEKLYALAK